MEAAQILFLIVAVVTLGAALMVVTARNLVHSALWLILTLFGIAIFYAILNAGFLAIAQVVIYIGAIAILFIFVVMMTRRVQGETGPALNNGWWPAAVLGVVLFAGLAWMLSTWDQFHITQPALPEGDPLMTLGSALVDPNRYALNFELASVLLLAAMVGAIMIAWERERK